MNALVRFLLILIFVVLALLAWLFIEQNDEMVPLWLWRTLPEQKVGVWLLLSFILGGVFGLILGFGLMTRVKNRLKISRLQKKAGSFAGNNKMGNRKKHA